MNRTVSRINFEYILKYYIIVFFSFIVVVLEKINKARPHPYKTIVKLQRVQEAEVAFKVWWCNHFLETSPAGDGIYTSGQNEKR